MSGLLHRLAMQARGTPPNSVSRVRPAQSLHAQVPVARPETDREDLAGPPGFPAAPLPQAPDLQVATRMTRPREVGPDTVKLSSSRDPAPAPAAESIVARAPHRESRARDTDRPDTARTPGQSVFEAPAPLLDDVPVAGTPPAISPAIVKAAAASALADPARAQATQVHVHIGRIEVIAGGAEPAAPKKSRPEARKTLPLSDYLARRRQP